MRIRYVLLFICYLLYVGDVMAETLHVESAKLGALSDQRNQLSFLIKTLNESVSQLDALQIELNINQESVRTLEIKSKEARDNLEKKQKYDRENPGEITDKLLQAQEQNRQSTGALKEAKSKLVEIKQRIIEKNKNWSTQNSQFKLLRQSFESEIDSLVDTQLQIRVEKLQVSKQIEARGQVSCGEDSMRVCKEHSKEEAERSAIEQGSVIDFSALTEVKNYMLTKEELKSEVHANLTDEVVVQQKIVDDSTGFTQIRVTVNPVIGVQLRKQIAVDIRSEIYSMLGGPVEYVAAELSELKRGNAPQDMGDKHHHEPPAGKEITRIGQVVAVKQQYGYLIFNSSENSSAKGIDVVVIIKDGQQVVGKAEKRFGANVSAVFDKDILRSVENGDAVYVYK